MERINFIFTPEWFYPDINDTMTPEERKEAERWKQDSLKQLYQLGTQEKPAGMSSSGRFLYTVSAAYFKQLTALPELELARDKAKVVLTPETEEYLMAAVPFGIGAEYITSAWLKNVFKKLHAVYKEQIKDYEGTVAMYLTEQNQNLRVPERVFFHLVEKNTGAPFAFMATYATKQNNKVAHFPLQYALTEYKKDRSRLISLLSTLNKAADVSPIIDEFMRSGELFHPLELNEQEAFSFLQDVEMIEAAGILCRIPNWWRRKSMKPVLTMKIGEDKPSLFGMDSLLSAKPQLEIDGVPLTREELLDLLAQTEGLAMIKGKWIHIDHARLRELLEKMDEGMDPVSFMDALRMQMKDEERDPDNGVIISNGQWLNSLLNTLRHPEKIKKAPVPASVNATLRPYQKDGYDWLNYMNTLGFGACLADDMGLGKTLQILTFLENMHAQNPDARVLLIVPASLLGNWQSERDRFVPDMDMVVLHSLGKKGMTEKINEKHFLYITTYGMALRTEELRKRTWDCVILDEAQAIKNPLSKQTRSIKQLASKQRIALTGTPIENDLSNLWSLFDFLNKGLLGSAKEFSDYCSSLEQSPEQYAGLKAMIRPFLLRRMKTDKKIIKDLPDKVEMVQYTDLSKKQVMLYRKLLEETERELKESSGMERRGMVLALLLKLKQICNHPDQYLGAQNYNPEDSGKFQALKEICETIYEKRERVLIFTQFTEIIPYLNAFLKEIFHAEGRTIHGRVPVKSRQNIVEEFQNGDDYIPYIICSVKAAGTGLNLTRASHVIHLDRWWNPAVENQATDRAFRIGQKKNVMVYKFVNKGTVEEKIDLLINTKKELAENVIEAGAESFVTEMSNEELMNLLRLEV